MANILPVDIYSFLRTGLLFVLELRLMTSALKKWNGKYFTFLTQLFDFKNRRRKNQNFGYSSTCPNPNNVGGQDHRGCLSLSGELVFTSFPKVHRCDKSVCLVNV